MKVSSKIYKGIEYIQLSDLPKDQKEKIILNLEEEQLIKILIDDKIVSNCVQYKEYEKWFESTYSPEASVLVAAKKGSFSVPAMQVALEKA